MSIEHGINIEYQPTNRAEDKLSEFLRFFDEQAAGGFTSRSGEVYKPEEIAVMRERIRQNFLTLAELSPDLMLSTADILESRDGAPLSQMALQGITSDKGLAEAYRLFLIKSLRELANTMSN